MFVITGITGNVGGKLASLLLDSGAEVAGLARDASKVKLSAAGLKIVETDFNDTALLAQVFTGAESVFIMNPPFFNSEDPLKENLALVERYSEAILASRPGKIVYLSSVGAQHSNGIGHIGKSHDLEQLMRQLPVPTAGIRAAYFMDNFAGVISQVKESGKLTSLFNSKELTLPMIATGDIARHAARLMKEDWAGHRVIELEAPAAYSMTDAAAILSNLLQRDIEVETTAEAEYPALFKAWGMPPKSVALMIGSVNSFNTGRASFELAGTEHEHGQTTLAAYFETLIN